MNYSQFIHGKTLGGRNYELVALTADLRGRETELEAIAQKYRFWGAQPPVSNPIAVGVFHYGDKLLLAQAMQAVRRNGQPAADVQGRPFTQHRYVFIPPHTLSDLSGRLWLLLNWIMEETRGIPIFDHFEPDMRPITAPQFSGNWYDSTEELDKLERSLSLRDKRGHPVLLSALAALINRKRVVFDAAAANDVFSEDLLEGALLLLPAACRAAASVAAGALDEKICAQADLMVKTNGAPAGSLPADLIWAKRANNEFFGKTDKSTLNSPYTHFLEPVLNQAQSRKSLLRLLDGLKTVGGSAVADPWRALNNGAFTAQLIPALPNPAARTKYWRSALKNLSPDDWEAVLPTIVDETGLEIAWAELQKLSKKQPDKYAPLVFRLWNNFSREYIAYVLREELPSDLPLAENLIRRGLLPRLGQDYHADLFELCMVALSACAGQSRERASSLLRVVMEANLFDHPTEQFTLRETLLAARPNKAALLDFFKTEIAPLIPTLSLGDLSASRGYQGLTQRAPETAALLDEVVSRRSKSLDKLPELASAAEMSLVERRDLYAAALNAWRPSYAVGRPLLTDLVTQWIAAYPPEDRPHLTFVTAALGNWLNTEAPEDLRPLLTVPDTPFFIEDWQRLGDDLFPAPLGRVSFLDHVTEGNPTTTMLQHWLPVVAADSSAKTLFEAGYTWYSLQTDGPAWLAEAIAQLLGYQPVPLSSLVPLLARLENALDVPQSTLFKFLESLPRQGDDDMGLILATYLPQMAAGKAVNPEEIPVWQMLDTQAPKVAAVYKTLAEGQKNPALDMFNQLKLGAALNEAPEYAAAMAHWLQLCGKGNWISGRLLETLLEQWLADPAAVDPALLGSLLRSGLSVKYTFSDWLNLANICWLPAYQSLWPLSGQPSPNARQQAQVLSAAKACAADYTTSLQAEKLVVACQNWGLSRARLAELTAHLPQKTCNFRLLHPYLYVNGSVIEPDSHTNQNLLTRAIQTIPADAAEQAQLDPFLIHLLAQQLQSADGLSYITAWQGVAGDAKRYRKAMTAAVLDLAPEYFSLLAQCARQLQRQGDKILSKTIILALDSYWNEEKRKLGR